MRPWLSRTACRHVLAHWRPTVSASCPGEKIEGGEDAGRGTPELETLLKGVFEKRRFLAFLKDFIVFGDTGQGLAKILAGYHQFHAVRHAVDRTLEATSPGGDRKVG